MSMYRVVACVFGRGCLLWPVCSLGKTLLAFALLHVVLQGQTCLSLQVSLDFLLLHSSPLWWKGGEGNGTPLQYSCLENPMDRGAWWVAVHGVAKSRTRLRDFTFTFPFHALENEMATHSSVLAWRIPGGARWAAIYGVTQSRTRLKWLSSMMKRASCFGVNSRRSCSSSQNHSTSSSPSLVIGA